MKKVIFLLGTSRSDGNTRKLIDIVNQEISAPIIDLNDYSFSFYDYNNENKDDDFVKIIEEILQYETIVFATPVYWYAMSAQLKTFFDRFSDLLRLRKPLGKALKGRQTYLISTGTEPHIPEGFEIPFRRTSEYLDMSYQEALYAQITEDMNINVADRDKAVQFQQRLFAS